LARIIPPLLVIVCLLSGARPAAAQDNLEKRIDQLVQRVEQLEAKQRAPVTEVHRDVGGAAFFLFGAFCALWAQNTNRNPWLWFILGLFFNVITVLVLLVKNSDDRKLARGEPASTGTMIILAIVGGFLILTALAAIVFWLFVAAPVLKGQR
jgi:hypothetical protein